MKTALPLTLSSLLFLIVVAPANSQPFDGGFRNRVPNLNGAWYMNDDGDLPCRIIQRRPDGRRVHQ
jgi:hypothetical protein